MERDLFGHPLSKAQRKRDKLQAQYDWEVSILKQWMERVGYTMEEFIEDVERSPGIKLHDGTVMHLGVPGTYRHMPGEEYGRWAFVIHRGMQHLNITRPWRHTTLHQSDGN
jgi:hypothetical protein